MSRRTVVALWIGTVLLTAAVIGLRLSGVAKGPYADIYTLAAWAITFSTLGAIIAAKRPGTRVGLLFLGVGCAEAVVIALGQTAHDLLARPSLAGTLGLASEAFRLVAFFALTLVLLIFPTGSLLSRRWRVAAWMSAIGLGAAWVGEALIPGAADEVWKSPILVRSSAVNAILSTVALPGYLMIVAGIVSLGVRFKRSTFEVRRQIKLFVVGVIAVAIFITAMTVLFARQMSGPLGEIVWTTPAIVLPVAVTMAVMRYGLYEIDRIISRTLAYAVVTALLGGTFGVLVLVPTSLLGSGGKTPGWLVAVATLVVFGLFRPVLRRVRSVIDRRFNRSRYDAARTIEAFSARLRDEIDLATLREELTDIIGQTMQPEHVSVWLRGAKQ